MKKTKKVLAVAAVLTACFAVNAQAAGWEQDEAGKYSYLMESGAYARDQIMDIDGVTYGFDSGANMMTGWGQLNGDWYYFEESGAMVKGWKDLGGTWYYLDPTTGIMKTGKYKIGANLYISDDSGALHVNGRFDGPDGYAYEADENGVILRNMYKESANGSGVLFKYEDDGRIRLANDSTRNISAAEGGNFLSEDYLTMENFEEFASSIKEHAEQAITELKNDLYEDYQDAMEEATTYKERKSKRAKWESRATNQLEKVSLTEEEISSFISDVENGTYDPDSEY